MKTGIELITDEREKQKKKYSAEHDKHYVHGELIESAIFCGDNGTVFATGAGESCWCLAGKAFDEHDKIKNLAAAGALIAAEIDRLQAEKSDK